MCSYQRVLAAWFAAAVLVFFVGHVTSAAETSKEKQPETAATTFKYGTKTTVNGLTYRVPEDMPIEKRNGIEAPIPFDEYMYGKFKQLDARLESIELKLGKIESSLVDLREQKQKNLASR